MKLKRVLHIVMAAFAAVAAAVLFVTYGTVLPSAPFISVTLDGPVDMGSDGQLTVVTDTDSRRALILNADNDLTGIMDCETIDSPINAITDVCASDGLVYLSGVRYAPDSDLIDKERIVAYDKGGNYQGVVYEMEGSQSSTPSIVSLNDAPEGIVFVSQIYSEWDPKQDDGATLPTLNKIVFSAVSSNEAHELTTLEVSDPHVRGAAYSGGDTPRYAILNSFGALLHWDSSQAPLTYAEHVFTDIDADDGGTVYACDDQTGALCAISPDFTGVRTLIPNGGFQSVHESNGVVSLCNSTTNNVTLSDLSGTVINEFSEVKPSIGYSARMVLVWASGLYLVALVLTLATRTLIRKVKAGDTSGISPLFAAVAVVTTVAIAVTNLSYASYQSALESRANEINMCADYLESSTYPMSESMEKLANRNIVRALDESDSDTTQDFINVISPVMRLVNSASANNIGMYYNLYGKDENGAFYLFGSADEFAMGSSARLLDNTLDAAFKTDFAEAKTLLVGRTRYDATQYRLVQIPSTDNSGIAGVIEIGSKMRSFEASLTNNLAQRLLTLLVMVLVVYLAYCELSACVKRLYAYRQQQQEDAVGAISLLTRPFTLTITMLASIDSVMTVLIARDLLEKVGIGDSSALLALPAVMLGIGLVIGQGLYGVCGSRVGLRRLVATGALAMLLFACFTGAAVVSGNFWLYCVAKLTMSVPFGMLYALGYSMQRLASNESQRQIAAGDVKRTDTSAAALGTVLGGYAAHMFGNGWVYALVAVACLLVIFLALGMLPKRMSPLEVLANAGTENGQNEQEAPSTRFLDFVKTTPAASIALLVVLPATIAAGYASFLFPLFSVDLGLSKPDINNIYVLGQLVVYVCISQLEAIERRFGKWRMAMAGIAFLGVVFLLFAFNTTLVWSFAVIALVGVLCKSTDSWKALWLKTASGAGVHPARATGAMFATRSLALVAQPFILGALLGVADSVAVIAIGIICLACAALFFLVTRSTPLADMR